MYVVTVAARCVITDTVCNNVKVLSGLERSEYPGNALTVVHHGSCLRLYSCAAREPCRSIRSDLFDFRMRKVRSGNDPEPDPDRDPADRRRSSPLSGSDLSVVYQVHSLPRPTARLCVSPHSHTRDTRILYRRVRCTPAHRRDARRDTRPDRAPLTADTPHTL